MKPNNILVAAFLLVIIGVALAAVYFDDFQGVVPGSIDTNATFSGNIQYEGETRCHSIRVQENATRIHCILTCGGSDFDLYGRLSVTPTTFEYDFRGYESGGEDLYYDEPAEGIWHLMVRSYSGIGHYDLMIEIEYSSL
ncbi:MAG: hypothetical protein JW779_03100 [Candidatus Thorarchaeota archaeon]|nr:hypothetical protein [Candidatus Thorarchaeota archaeon]